MAMEKMRKQGHDMMQANLAGIRRDIVNLAHNYSNAQKAVRKATSNDPWGPSSTLMAEIADLTYNVVAFTEIMQMLWKRLNDHGKNWRHVYKALVLLEYLIKTGTDKVTQQCKENIYAIETLKDFQYMEGPKDQGINVREKAKQLVALLKDDERLKNERARALKAKERSAQCLSGFGSDGMDTMSPVSSDFQDWEPCNLNESSSARRTTANPSSTELEAARPQTVGEEELQLQLALAMSREEAEQEEQRRRSDDVRLQLALSQSQQDFKTPQTEKQSHMLDLLDVNLGEASGSPGQTDPWGIPITAPPQRTQAQNDPWSAPTTNNTSPVKDPWSPVSPQRPIAAIDPWKPPSTGVAAAAAAVASLVPADPWSPVQAASKPLSPPPLGFTIPPVTNSSFSSTSNGFNGTGSRFNNFTSQNQNDPSPVEEFDEFDVISNRNKIRVSPPPVNNGSSSAPSDPFDLRGMNDNLPASTGAIKKTPHSFLGENSALVNLDNLVSASSTIKSSTQGPAANVPYSANPFASVTPPPPRPTINQIRQDPWTSNTNSTANPFLL